MKYIVYLTKNLKSKINGINRIYVGVHQTENPETFDGYLGCGVYVNQPSTYMYGKTPFQKAVKKYGTDAFERTILFVYDLKEDAYEKEKEIVNLDFLKQDYTYNACLGGISYSNYKKLYQFDLEGNLKKVWDFSIEAYEFYGIPMEKFEYAIQDKHPLLDSFWSTTENINLSEYSTKPWGSPKVTHLYSKNGKWLKEFISRKACGDYLEKDESTICNAIQRQSLIDDQYYVTDKLTDEFKPKPRIQYMKTKFYVYDKTNKFYGEFIGKEVMNVINLKSWNGIRDIFRDNKGWYKDFYLSLESIDKVPEKVWKNKIKVDIFDKYGNFIETLNTVKEVKEKYKVPASKIKNIQQGDRYFKDWIFKYHTTTQ